MSVSQASKQRYSKDWQQAAYLEAEWSDFLLPDFEESDQDVDPQNGRVRPVFYQRIADLIVGWLSSVERPAKRYCDVGGSSGRTLYEMAAKATTISELVLAEPSTELADWAKKLLLKQGEVDWIPIVCEWQKCSFAKPKSLPAPIIFPNRSVEIYNCPAEEVPRPAKYFDLISCLNVVDRVASPVGLISTLTNLLAPGGLLVVASPLEFDERFVPDRESWVRDLNELFVADEWTSVGETSLIYDMRRYRREWIRYNSQVVAKSKKAGK